MRKEQKINRIGILLGAFVIFSVNVMGQSKDYILSEGNSCKAALSYGIDSCREVMSLNGMEIVGYKEKGKILNERQAQKIIDKMLDDEALFPRETGINMWELNSKKWFVEHRETVPMPCDLDSLRYILEANVIPGCEWGEVRGTYKGKAFKTYVVMNEETRFYYNNIFIHTNTAKEITMRPDGSKIVSWPQRPWLIKKTGPDTWSYESTTDSANPKKRDVE